jgi:ankyrin repeat protein
LDPTSADPSLSDKLRWNTGQFALGGPDLDPLVDPQGQPERTPLHIAAVYGDLKLAKDLLLGISDTNETDEQGSTPLHLAVLYNHSDIAKVLLDHPAIDPSIQDITGRTAGDLALSNPDLNFVVDPRFFSSKKPLITDVKC